MANTQRDPVCGMEVDTRDAAAKSQHQEPNLLLLQ